MPDLRRLVQQRTSNSALLNWGDIETAPISAKEIRHWLIEYQGEFMVMYEDTRSSVFGIFFAKDRTKFRSYMMVLDQHCLVVVCSSMVEHIPFYV